MTGATELNSKSPMILVESFIGFQRHIDLGAGVIEPHLPRLFHELLVEVLGARPAAVRYLITLALEITAEVLMSRPPTRTATTLPRCTTICCTSLRIAISTPLR